MNDLSLDVMGRIHDHCERFELAWQDRHRPRLQAFLADAREPERSVLLAELLALELELRVMAGEQPEKSDYRIQFPDPDDGEVIEQVFSQFRKADDEPERLTMSMPTTDRISLTATPASSHTLTIPKIDGYEILEVLGRGGMGVVYKARDLQLKRLVALKMILSGEHAGPQLLARFRTEAELVARLQHPNIVQIFDVGEQQGHPFIAFEFIDGKTLADLINREPQPSRIAAELLEAMAFAVHYAHQHGIVHRDLKPANILLAQQVTPVTPGFPSETRDWREPSSGYGSALSGQRATSTGLVPKITDFGLAKDLVNSPDHSSTGAILGTPNYMSPEQAQGRVREIGPASDIYSLGAILYMLLTGRPPFQGTTPIETITMVVKAEPVPPSQLQPKLARDLETICLKCLQKDPARRYATAGALADDLRRFLNDETILARPSGYLEKTWRLCRRNPVVAGLIAVVFAVLIAGVVVSANYAYLANREADTARNEKTRAESIAQRARERAYLADLRQVQFAWDENDLGTVYDLLNAQHPDQTDGVDLRHFEWHYWNRMANVSSRIVGRHAAGVKCISVSPDGKLIASGGRDEVIRIWELGHDKERLILTGHRGDVNSVSFHPDGKHLSSAGDDGSVRIWNIKTGKEFKVLAGHAGIVNGVSISHDGKWIASSGEDNTLKIWNATTGAETSTLPHPCAVHGVAFSPDNTRVVSGGEDFNARLWNLMTSQVIYTLSGHQKSVRGVAFSPDGKTIATCSRDSTAKLWDAETGHLRNTLRGHRWDIWSIAFSPDGKRLVTDNFDRTLKMWNAETGDLEETFKGHLFSVANVAFHLDGQRVVSASEDGTVRMWDAPAGHRDHVQLRHSTRVASLACSPDCRWLVSCGGITDAGNSQLPQGELVLRDRQNALAPRTLTGHTTGVACAVFTPDSRILVTGGSHRGDANVPDAGGDVRFWDPVTGRQLAAWTGHAARVLSMAISPDGQWLVTGGVTGDILVRKMPEGKEQFALSGLMKEVTAMAISPDGKYLAAGSFDSTVRVWDLHTRTEIKSLLFKTVVGSVAFSPDGEQLAVADYNINAYLFNAKTWALEMQLRGHSGGVTSVTYSPDGRRLATGSEDTTAKIWDRASGQQLLTLRGHTELLRSVRFSPDGYHLYSGSWDRTVRIWDATPLK